ncbi:MAG: ABC transporter ATP-binding protein [Thermoleophilia bacterium]|nr:ABC transporter ATP-binding protein [Thermoleophilia bacterium]
MLLQIDNLTKRFGGLTAVDGFTAQVDEGEIVGLIGPNGAGKSTVFNLVTGVYPPTKGHVYFGGKDITRKRAHTVAELGIGRTFQMNLLFADFTVLQNVSASSQVKPRSSLFDMYFGTPRYRRNEAHIAERSLEILRLLGLEHYKDELAKNLPHGYQKMLGVARALATNPKLLLLDEPLGGMNPAEIDFSLQAIANARDSGVTVLIVEHNMQILSLCDRVVVISFGQKICEGSPQEVRENEEVISAYFGGEHGAARG